MDNISTEEYKSALFAFAVSTVLLAAALVLPAQLTLIFFPVAVVAIPFLIAYAVAKSGYLAGISAAVLCYAAGSLLNFPLSVLLASMSLPLAVTAGFVLRKKMRFRHSVMATCGAALAGMMLFVGALWLLTGQGPVAYAAGQLETSLNMLDAASVQALHQYVRLPDLISGAVTQAALDATPTARAVAKILEMFEESLNFYLVSAIGVFSLFMGLLGYLVPRAALKKHNTEVIAIPAFSDFALPNRFWLAYILSYMFAIIGASAGWPGFTILQFTVQSLYAFVLMIQGLSLLDFLYKKRKMGTGARVALHALAVLLTSLVLGGVLMWVGLFENIVRLRSRMETKGGTVV